MNTGEYLIVHKSVLPGYFDKVLSARLLLQSGAVKEVSEAVRQVGISRSTYYKYRDYVFAPTAMGATRRALFSLTLSHQKGVLGKVLTHLSGAEANILTILQNPPMGDRASVIIQADISAINVGMDGLIQSLCGLEGVRQATLLDLE